MDILLLVVCILACEGAGILGSFSTVKSIPSWYRGLKKPSFNPPEWLFGPAWTTLYLLMGVSLFLVLQEGIGETLVQNSLVIFVVQLALNILWSIIFFGRKSLGGAFAEILLLWAAILATIMCFWSVSALAALLLVPYLLWTSFATLLNYSIMKLNQSRNQNAENISAAS